MGEIQLTLLNLELFHHVLVLVLLDVLITLELGLFFPWHHHKCQFFPAQPAPAPPTFPQPVFPAIQPQPPVSSIVLPPPVTHQQSPIIEEVPPPPAQEVAAPPPTPFNPHVYPYLGFRYPIVPGYYTSYGRPLGGVYGSPIPSRFGQYGLNGLTNLGVPFFSKGFAIPGLASQFTMG